MKYRISHRILILMGILNINDSISSILWQNSSKHIFSESKITPRERSSLLISRPVILLWTKWLWLRCRGNPCICWYCTRGVGWWANFHRSVIFPIFHHCQNTGWLLNIAFIFDRCRRSSAAAPPVKYRCDSYDLRGTFARLKYCLRKN